MPASRAAPAFGLEDVGEGLKRMAVGLAKKVLVAGAMGPMADAAFSGSRPGVWTWARPGWGW